MTNDREVGGRLGALPGREELEREIAIAITREPAASETLRPAVARFVASAKARGVPPQEVIVALKEELRCRAMPRMRQDSYVALSESVVQWGIDEYYGTSRDR